MFNLSSRLDFLALDEQPSPQLPGLSLPDPPAEAVLSAVVPANEFPCALYCLLAPAVMRVVADQD